MNELRLTLFESTLLTSADVEVIPPSTTVLNDRGDTFTTPPYRIVRHPLPTRRAISIEEFEADMLAALSARQRA